MISASKREFRVFLLIVLLCISAMNLLSANDDTWIFAASPFASPIENDKTAELIPLYILKSFSSLGARSVSVNEQLRLDQQSYDDEIRDLYTSLQDTIFKRDALVLTMDTNDQHEKDLLEKEMEIDAIQDSIQEKKDEKALLSVDNYTIIEKDIQLWNDSTDTLYSEDTTSEYFYPRDINALITGSIEYSESFVDITTYVRLYPGKILKAQIREVGSITEIESIAKKISEALYSTLTNKEEISLTFSIEPKEAQEKSTIHINGTIVEYEGTEENAFAQVNLTSGIHEFYVDSPGYEGAVVTYSFFEASQYDVLIQLQKIETANVGFSIPATDGELFINTQKMGEQSTNENNAQEMQGFVTINGLPALGEFVSDDGIKTWFFLSADDTTLSDLQLGQYTFSFEPDTKNYEDIIEKNRKRMYNSYAALIVSLPLYFIANGQHLNEYNSWASGKSSGENIKKWETARNAAMGVSIGLGVNFLVQLGIYIHSANSILPEEVEARK